MPGPRLPMRKIRDVLRLSAAGMSKRKIAASLGMSATAAGECIRRAQRAGLTWPLPDGLTDEALERRLFPPPAVTAKDRLDPHGESQPRRGAELVGVAQRPASAIGGHHDDRTEDHPRQGWTARACQAARQRQPSLQDDGLQPRQLLPFQGALR